MRWCHAVVLSTSWLPKALWMQIQPDASYDKKTRGKKSGVIECNSFYCGDSVLGTGTHWVQKGFSARMWPLCGTVMINVANCIWPRAICEKKKTPQDWSWRISLGRLIEVGRLSLNMRCFVPQLHTDKKEIVAWGDENHTDLSLLPECGSRIPDTMPPLPSLYLQTESSNPSPLNSFVVWYLLTHVNSKRKASNTRTKHTLHKFP